MTSDPSEGHDVAVAITSDADYIYVAGTDYVPVNYEWRIEKRNKSDGGFAVELVDFSASGGNGCIELQWRTEAEIDNWKWLITRAETGDRDWEQIAEVLAKGSLSEYQYIDSLVSPGACYWYKLGDVDNSGNITWHGPVNASVRTPPKAESLRMWEAVPNPFTQKTVIQLQIADYRLKIKDCKLEIYDLGGRVVRTFQITNYQITKVVWDGRDNDGKLVPTGVYFCSLKGIPDRHGDALRILLPRNEMGSKLTCKLIRL